MAKAPAAKKVAPKKAAKPAATERRRVAPPVRDRETGLTPKQAIFVIEYLVDLNATQAAIRAKYSARTAEDIGRQLLRKTPVAAAIQKAMDERAKRTEITQDKVLQHWWSIATADPNELVQFRRTCCRYCHGKGFNYQWVDEQEFAQVVASIEIMNAKKKRGRPALLPTDEGGFGFVRVKPPHADCPKCWGEGTPDVFAHDTRHLEGPARLLYAGTKLTQAGFEIKMQDQGKALENVARHLGMFKERIEIDDKGIEKLDEVGRASRLAAIFAKIEARLAEERDDPAN
ncbi:terminase small subunit [Sphingopyxis sp. FD7]|uniref:terminase small subunit n=1 Tax=Sphingopyxis sp. FD7 TaxID=1914525 RepID=UPI000DC612C0|nr:terminase small subunit [Sphingopyxis sp. FD7]BBB13642.1 terminase small subunit [Sphingopyxis sp. FD7]